MNLARRGAARIAILLNESNPAHAAYRASAQRACAALNLAAVWVIASAPAELAGAVEQIVNQRSQAVAAVADPMYFSESVKLQKLMQATRLPVADGHPEHVVAGGLLSYTSNFVANFRYAARYVDKIFKGAKPADLPVEQPTKFELVIIRVSGRLADGRRCEPSAAVPVWSHVHTFAIAIHVH